MPLTNLQNLSANVDPSSLIAVSADDAVILAAAYWFVSTNWAVDAAEVAEALGADVKTTNKILRRLSSAGLLVAEHINGEKALTWQSMYATPESSEEAETEQAFIDTFRIEAATAVRSARVAGTGPRYTEEQLTAGLAARAAGKTNREVAEAAGVKSPNYFAKTLKALEADRERSLRGTAK
jgi:hypothetical protein